MARSLDLRSYQENILSRLKELGQPGQTKSNSRLGVKIGEDRLLVDLEEISEVAPVPEIHAVPLTRPWFLGMANVRGVLYGVNDLAQLAGQTMTVANSSNSRILLAHQKYKANIALLVTGLLGLRNLDQMQEQPAADADRPWLGGRLFKDDAGQPWQELLIRELISNPEFIRVGIM